MVQISQEGPDLTIRPGLAEDLEGICKIYNWYISNTAITFDIAQVSVESRRPWFEQFSEHGRYQLWVAEVSGEIAGYAASMPFRSKAAYDPSVENSIYLAPKFKGRGLGKVLLTHLVNKLSIEDVHRVLACITLPNDISIKMHKNLGFSEIGVFSEVGRKFNQYHDVVWLEKAL